MSDNLLSTTQLPTSGPFVHPRGTTEGYQEVVIVSGTSGSSSIGKNEDSAAISGDAGTPAMAIRKATPANTSDTDGDYEILQMSGGRLWVSALSEAISHTTTVTLTRPSDTTAYTALDVIGDTNGSAILTFANMSKTGGGDVIITSVELEIDVAAKPSGMDGFYLHLYNASPTAIADNAAFNFPSADRGKKLGKILIASPTDEGDTLFSDNDQINKHIKLSSTNLYCILQTVGAYTPTSAAVKKITIHTIDI
jgi:hypothetical protein